MLAFLGRLRKRMDATGFPPDDRLLKTVNKAYDTMHELRVLLHYLACERTA